MSEPGYLLPNGCRLEPGCRVRVPAADIWKIPNEDIVKYDLYLEPESASSGSEVVARRLRVGGSPCASPR